MSVQILIGGQDYSSYVDFATLRITSNIAVTTDTANFDVVISKKSIPRPKGGQELKIINGSITEFGGVVLNPKETALATDQMKYTIQAKDYVYWFNKRVVTNTYNSYSIGNIVKDIVTNFTSGFTSNNVQGTGNAFILTQKKFDHIAPFDCLKQLADYIGFWAWIDYNKDVHFGPLMTVQSPLPNNTLLPDIDTSNYFDLSFEEDVSQIRNQIYFYGHKVATTYPITENYPTDGQTTTFNSTYEPKHSLTSITIKINGATQTNALDIANGLPNNTAADGKVYVNYKNKSYRFNVAPAAGGIFSITYNPMLETVNMYNDPNAFNVMKQRDGQDGVYEFGVRDPKLSSLDMSLVNTRGAMELYKYAYPHYTGMFSSFLQGWQAGQYFYLTSNNRMDGMFQNQIFFVIKVDKQAVAHPNGTIIFKYIISFSNTPYSF